MKSFLKRLTALLLVLSMSLSLLCTGVWAEELAEEPTTEIPAVEEAEEPAEEEEAPVEEPGEEIPAEEEVPEDVPAEEEAPAEEESPAEEDIPEEQPAEEKVPAEEAPEEEPVEEVPAEEAPEAMDAVDFGQCGDDVYWSLDDAGTLTISGEGAMWPGYWDWWDDVSGSPWGSWVSQIVSVVIEEGVTEIGENCFEQHRALRSVTLPDSLRGIGMEAFSHCSNLEEINLPDGLGWINDNAFDGCESLTEMILPDSAVLGTSVLYYCTNLRWVHLPESLTEIPDYTLGGCENLESVNIPASVQYIGRDAFAWCKSLTEIHFSEGLTRIGEGAFFCCNGLTSVELPDSVEELGVIAFADCVNLTEVRLSEGLNTIDEEAFNGCKKLAKIVIPDSVVKIGKLAFYDCKGLTSVYIGAGMEDCSNWPFLGCTALVAYEVSAANPYFTVSDGAVYNAAMTELVAIPAGRIGGYAVPEGVTLIRKEAGASCKLSGLILPSTLKTIRSGAFSSSRLTELVIPASVTSIGDSAFSKSKLESIRIPDKVTKLGKEAFLGCKALKSVQIGKGIQSIPVAAFELCTALETITIPSTVSTIGEAAFANSGLKTVVMKEGVQTIGWHAFLYCESLTELKLPDSVKTVENYAFYMSGLQKLTLGAGVEVFPGVALDRTNSLLSIEVSPANAYFSSIDGVLFDKAQTKLIRYPSAKPDVSYTIPNTVKTLGAHSMAMTPNLEAVLIPKQVTTINVELFFFYDEMDDSIPEKNMKSSSMRKKAVYFCGEAPTIKSWAFDGMNITAYYPKGFTTWTSSKRGSYGSNKITWTEWTKITVPTISAVSNGSTGIKISWEKLSAADGYELFRSVNGGEWSQIVKITSNATLSYTDTDVKAGSTYQYRLRSTKDLVHSNFRETEVITRQLAKPTVTAVSNLKDGIQIEWKKQSSATGYYIYRKKGSGDWSQIKKITSNATVSYTDTGATSGGTKYSYRIRSYKGDSKSPYSDTMELYRLTRPEISSIANTSDGIQIKWGRKSTATGYYIYRKKGSGDWSQIKKITSNTTVSYTDTGATTNGSKYQYRIQSYKSTSKSSNSPAKTIYRLKRPTISSLTNVTGCKMKVVWSENTKADGYRIEYSTSSSFSTTKAVTVTGSATVSKTISDLTKDKTYYVRIRAYKKVDGVTYNSAWAAKQSVKISK